MSKLDFDYAVFIGRLQPPHKEHINQIKRGLKLARYGVIVALGSHRAAPNIKNPWCAVERENMVRACFNSADNARIQFVQVRDYYYNNTMWFTDLHNQIYSKIRENTPGDERICLIGHKKDASSWYIDALPQEWNRQLSQPKNLLNATDIRNAVFRRDLKFTKDLCEEVYEQIIDWTNTDQCKNLTEEWKYIQEYKAMWSKAPYPVTFVTTDAVVVKNGHVLLVRRRFNPGKGLLALPGGFIDQEQSIQNSMLRELKEETRILMPKHQLENAIVDNKVFDHPQRSSRGRTITHAYCLKLPDGGDLPQVKGSDDAERALWIPISDLWVRENEFYEDHCHIIEYFTRKL